MDAVLEASARDQHGTVQTLGPLIHNPQALDLIRRRGVSVADDPGAVRDGTVVVRAHGIPIQELRGLKERQKKGELAIVNATCPEVAKVHSRIKKWSPKGYFVVILGTHGHAESVAHQSFAEHGSVIVANMEEARALTDAQLAKALVVAQTTFTVKDFQAISDYIRSRSGACIVENTICEDTWTRQKEAEEIAQAADYVIVVGGKASSNTKHLAELAAEFRQAGAVRGDRLGDGPIRLPRARETVGVMAGASTPTWLVEEVVDVLEQHGSSSHGLPVPERRLHLPAQAGRGRRLPDPGHLRLDRPAVHLALPRHQRRLRPGHVPADPLPGPPGPGLQGSRPGPPSGAQPAASCSAPPSWPWPRPSCWPPPWGSAPSWWWAAPPCSAWSTSGSLRLGGFTVSLKSIPGSKDVLVALALAVVALALPLWHDGRPWDARAWAGVLLVSALVFARTTTYNLKDMQNDQILGRETLPILFGRRATRFLLLAFLAAALAATVAVTFLEPSAHPWLTSAILAACCGYPAFHLWFFQERFSAGKSRLEPWVETSFYLAGLLALV